jgi:hypothetical protein
MEGLKKKDNSKKYQIVKKQTGNSVEGLSLPLIEVFHPAEAN